MRNRNIGALLPALVALSACGGSDGPTFDSYNKEFDGIVSDLVSQGVDDYTPGGDIPTSGTATYRGIVGFDADFRETYVGRMTINADFDAAAPDTFTGGADKFVDSEDGPVAGRLNITFGALDRFADTTVDYQALIDLDGTLTDSSGVKLTVSSTADGDFWGANHEAMIGDVIGTMSSTYGNELIEGGYITQR